MGSPCIKISSEIPVWSKEVGGPTAHVPIRSEFVSLAYKAQSEGVRLEKWSNVWFKLRIPLFL